MTKTTTVASKAFVAIVAAAMVFSLIAPAAKAATMTATELQAQITALMAQIAALQGGNTTTTTTTTTSTCVAIPAPLTMGAKGANVTALQNYLIAAKQSIPAGATGFFGGQTKSALAAFQSANGIMPAVGYYGPVTAAKMAAMCTPVTTPGTTTPGTTTPGTTTTLKGEASLDKFTIDDADDTDVSEGTDDTEIGMFTAKFNDGDAEISRMDLSIKKSGAKAWDVFDTVSLWVNDKKIGEVDASSKSDYLDDSSTFSSLRFSDLKLVAMEDKEVEISVRATIKDNLDSGDQGNWDLRALSMRYFDAAGVASTESTQDDLDETAAGSAKATFNIEAAGINEELKFSLSSNNPAASDVIVDETNTTKNITVLEYTIEAKKGDIDLTTLAVKLNTTGVGATIGNVIGKVVLEVDGKKYNDDSTLISVPTTTQTYIYDINDEVTVNDGDKITVKVMVDFKRQGGSSPMYANGSTVMAEVSSVQRDATEATGADDLTSANNQFTGTSIGKVHTLVAKGIVVPSSKVVMTTDTQGTNDTLGKFTIKFDVKAVEGDFYVAKQATIGTAATSGVEFTVSGGAASTTGSLSSTADEDTVGVYTVRDGESETFTLTVTVDPTASGTFNVTLGGVNYTANTNGTTATTLYVPNPVQDFRTGDESVQGS